MTRPSTAAGTLAAQPPQRIGSSPGSGAISGNSRVAPHPAPVDPVLQPPQAGALGGERAARGDRLPSPVPISASARRCGTARRSGLPASARRRLAASGGPWPHGVDARPSRADAPSIVATSPAAKICGSAGRAQGFVDRDKAALRRAAARSRRATAPPRPRSPTAPRRTRSRRPSAQTSRPGSTRTTGVVGDKPRCRARAKICSNRRPTRRLCDGSSASRVTSVTSSAAPHSRASRCCADKRELDPAGAAADHGEPQPRHLPCARQQRLPARRETGDRLDRDRVLGRARAHRRARGAEPMSSDSKS